MSFQLLKKTASVITLITFLSTNSIYASPESKSIFKNKKIDYQKLSDKNEGAIQKKKAILSGEDTAQSESTKRETRKILSSHLSDISLIHIPEELGRVVEVYQNPGQDNSRLVVHIQDLHTNPEASLNLAKILEILLKDYNLGLVCSEGADGAVDTSSVSSFPDAKVREKVARLFIDSGELTGEEYLSITKYPELPIWGIENKEIYFKNIAEFNNIMKFNPDSEVFISQAKKALEELKPRICSKELLAIDQKESDYESQKAETADYLKYISSYLQKLNIPTANYKNVALLNETINQESGIDQQKIMQESQNLLLNLQSAIAAKSNRGDMDALMAKASLFKDQKISPFSFYSYLKDLANKHLKDQLTKYPNLTGFVDYLTKVNSLDSTKLFTEMEDLTYEIKQRIARNDEEKTFIQALRNIKFLESFFNLKISNEELDYYLQDKESCKVSFFENFLKPVLKKYNLSNFIDFNPLLIDSHLQELEDFYDIAKSRDFSMFNNTVSEIEKRNIKVSALITGGFHTKGLTRLLKDKGYSYIVISPFSKTEIDEENYRYLLSGKRKPIEELIQQLDSQETQETTTANKPSSDLRVPMISKDRKIEAVTKVGGVEDVVLLSLYDKEIAPQIAKLDSELVKIESLKEQLLTALYLSKIKKGVTEFPVKEGVSVFVTASMPEAAFLIAPTGNLKFTKLKNNKVNIKSVDIKEIPDLEPPAERYGGVSGAEIQKALGLKPDEPVELLYEGKPDTENIAGLLELVNPKDGMKFEALDRIEGLVSKNESQVVFIVDYILRLKKERKREIASILAEWSKGKVSYAVNLIKSAINNTEAWRPFMDSISKDVKKGADAVARNKITFDKAREGVTGYAATIIEGGGLLEVANSIDLTNLNQIERARLAQPRLARHHFTSGKIPLFCSSLLGGAGSRYIKSIIEEKDFTKELMTLLDNKSRGMGKFMKSFKAALPVGDTGIPIIALQLGNDFDILKQGIVSMAAYNNADEARQFIKAVFASKGIKDPNILLFVQLITPRRIPTRKALEEFFGKEGRPDNAVQLLEYCDKHAGEIALNEKGDPIFGPENHWDFMKYLIEEGFFLDILKTVMDKGKLRDRILRISNQDDLGPAVGEERPGQLAVNTLIDKLQDKGGLYEFMDYIDSMPAAQWKAYRDSDKYWQDLRKRVGSVVEGGLTPTYNSTAGGIFDMVWPDGTRTTLIAERANIKGKALAERNVTNSNTIEISCLAIAAMCQFRPKDILKMIETKEKKGDFSPAQKNLLKEATEQIENMIPVRQQIKIAKSSKDFEIPMQGTERDIHGALGRVINMILFEGESMQTFTAKTRENDLALLKGDINIEEHRNKELLIARDLTFVPNKDLGQWHIALRAALALATYLNYREGPTVRPLEEILAGLQEKTADTFLVALKKAGYHLATKEDVEKISQMDENELTKEFQIHPSKYGWYAILWALENDKKSKINKAYAEDLLLVQKFMQSKGNTKLAGDEDLEAIKGNKDAYVAIKNMNPNDIIAYFLEAGLADTITNLPEDLFGRGYGYDIRGNALEIKGGIIDMTLGNIYAIGKLLALKYLKPGDKFLVTGDTRMHTPILRYAMALGAASVGADVDFSEEALSTGAHNVYSAENPKGYKAQVQVSGSHGVFQKNGAKIKIDLGNNRLDPVYGEELAAVYTGRQDIIAGANARNIKNAKVREVSGIEDAIVDMYDRSLPSTEKDEILVIDARAGGGGSLASKLLAKRGYEIIDVDEVFGILGQSADMRNLLSDQNNVAKILNILNEKWDSGKRKIAFMLNVHPDALMGRGIWDPSKPEAMIPAVTLINSINVNLREGMPQAIGGVLDGDADRIGAIKENGEDIPAFEMTIPYYERFLLDPQNKAAIIEMARYGEKLWLACDVRANSKLKRTLAKLDNSIKEEGRLDSNVLKLVYINTGYPPQLGFVAWRIQKMKEFVDSKPGLRDNPVFMENFRHLIHTYYTAEASGHNFFHASPGNPERPCDCAIAALVSLINIKETMDSIEVPALGMQRENAQPLVVLFETFPSVFTSNEIRVVIPNAVKIATAHKLGAWLQEKYGAQLLEQKTEKIKIDDFELQSVEDGLITVAGYKAQLKNGDSILIRWSNTGEQLTLIFEGHDMESLFNNIGIVYNKMLEEKQNVSGLDLADLEKEIKRIKEEMVKGMKKETTRLASTTPDPGRGSDWGLMNTMARLDIKAGSKITVLDMLLERIKDRRGIWSESSLRREFKDAEKLGLIRYTGTKDDEGRDVYEVLMSFTKDQLNSLPKPAQEMLDRGRIRDNEVSEIHNAIVDLKTKEIQQHIGDIFTSLLKQGHAISKDFITPYMMKSGLFRAQVRAGLANNATTNPTSNAQVFEQMIKSGEWVPIIKDMIEKGRTVQEIYDNLFIDYLVVPAIKIFAEEGVCERTNYMQGYVSYEFRPTFTSDPDIKLGDAGFEDQVNTALDELKRLDTLITERSGVLHNFFLKVPATHVGIEAGKRAIALGINVNFTLIATRDQYIECVKAYKAGVREYIQNGEKRGKVGQSPYAMSVASDFVSRTDREIDPLLTSDPTLKMQSGLAYAIGKVYKAFEEEFVHDADWNQFALENNIPIQQIYWGSTGVKINNVYTTNPHYAGPLRLKGTVNTAPPEVVDVMSESVPFDANVEEPDYKKHDTVLMRLPGLGIDIDKIQNNVYRSGLAAFAKDDQKTFKTIGEFIDKIRGERVKGENEMSRKTFQETPSYKLASLFSKLGLAYDPEGYGYITFEQDGENRAPRFGKSMEEAIAKIERFQRRHYGDSPDSFNEPAFIFGSGIGGQMTCSIPAVGLIVKHRNRELVVCDSLGTDYKAHEEKMVSLLRQNPKAKFLWAMGSKSGTTDETMINSQMNLKLQIRVWSRVFFGDEEGSRISETLISKLIDSKPLFDKRLSTLGLTNKETDVLRTVFKNLIVITGSWDDQKQSGSRIDRLVKSFLNDLYDNPEDRVVSILMMPNLGGRFQGISPNSFAYDALLGMNIREILEGAREVATKQREGVYVSEEKAMDLYLNKVQHLLIAMPNDISFRRISEALGQVAPESLGKGRRAKTPFGIQTYPYDKESINRAFKDIKFAGKKAYLVIDIEGEEPIRLDKDIEENNIIIRYTLKEISEKEVGKLIQFVEDMVARVGMFNTAKALLDVQEKDPALRGVNIFDGETAIKIMAGPKENDGNYGALKKLHDVYADINPFMQPDVEFAKKLVKGGRGVARFNIDGKTEDGLPARNQAERIEVYREDNQKVAQGPVLDKGSLGLRDGSEEFKTGSDAGQILQGSIEGVKVSAGNHNTENRNEISNVIHGLSPFVDLISLQHAALHSGVPLDTYQKMQALKAERNSLFSRIREISSTTRLTPQEEQTARELAALIVKAHNAGKSLDFVLYEDRDNPLAELIKEYADFLGVDLFGFGPAEQHKYFQRASGGIDVSMEVLIHSVKELSEVEKTQEQVINDGLVPEYLHGLYPTEVSEIYLRAYSDRFRQEEVQTETAVLMVKNVTKKANAVDAMVLFTRIMEIVNADKTTQFSLPSGLKYDSRDNPNALTTIEDIITAGQVAVPNEALHSDDTGTLHTAEIILTERAKINRTKQNQIQSVGAAAANFTDKSRRQEVESINKIGINPFLLFEAGRDRGDITIDENTIVLIGGGGDCAGLNYVNAETVIGLIKAGFRVVGVKNGPDGMLADDWEKNIVELTPELAEKMKPLPSTVIGSARVNLDKEEESGRDPYGKMKNRFGRAARIIGWGGNDHSQELKKISDRCGIPTLCVPKSIDNDFQTPAMMGFISAVMANRIIIKRASMDPTSPEAENTVAVFEVMGRKAGYLTLESSKACPYPRVVLLPEKSLKVTIQQVIDAANAGIKNFFVSEGFSFDENDPDLKKLLDANPGLKLRYEKAIKNPDRDKKGNPKLTGASLFVAGILEDLCNLKVQRTDLTYQARGASVSPFDIFLAKKFADAAVEMTVEDRVKPFNEKRTGLTFTYPGYIETGTVVAKPAEEVYPSRDLDSDGTSKEELVKWGVLGTGFPLPSKIASVESPQEPYASIEEAIMSNFYAVSISTRAHLGVSCVEIRAPSEAIVSACGRQQDLTKISNEHGLRDVVEATEESVLVLIPEQDVSFEEIADKIKEVYDKFGYVNVAISNDFPLKGTKLLQKVLAKDPILKAKFDKEAVNLKNGSFRFESGVSNFIVGLFNLLKSEGVIKNKASTRVTDLGYAFKGIAGSSDLNLQNRAALDSGV